jgi:ABC-type amino acid transport substrate-binding protein
VETHDRNNNLQRPLVGFSLCANLSTTNHPAVIEKIEPVEADTSVDYTNFLKPFEWQVWCVTLATVSSSFVAWIFFWFPLGISADMIFPFQVVVSAIIYEFLEFLNSERDERTLWQWFEDNLYLSSVNFVQQYAYEPTSGAGRIFGFSMAVWSMVMGATYTANLASLFVEELGQPFKVGDIDDAIRREYKICTWKGTNADEYIKNRYRTAIRVPMAEEIDTFQGLHNGTCDVTIAAAASWKGYQMDRKYNPSCDLEWVGKTVEQVASAFAVKADPAIKCTNLIRDVLNYHLVEMQSDGTMELLWDEYYNSNPDKIECAIADPEGEEDSEGDGRRLLSEGVKLQARKLKGGGGGANPGAAASTVAGDGDDESSSLTIKAMAGTFVLHAVFSAIAIVVGIFNYYRKQSLRAKKSEKISDTDDDELKDHVAGISMASGSCKNGKQVSTLLNKTGPVEEQLHALFEAQREMQQNQDSLAQQMDLVVSLLTKMRQDQLGAMEATEVGTNAAPPSKFSFFSS